MACCCEHSSAEGSDGDSLLPFIDTERVTCLNEMVEGSAKHAFKALSARTDRHCRVASPDGDATLVFKIPFISAVRVRSICVSGGADGRSPSSLRLHVNGEALDYSEALEGGATQELRTPEDLSAELWHAVKPNKFSSVHHLTVAMPASLRAGAPLEVFFLGLKGDSTGQKRTIVEAVYEARALPQDHAVDGDAARAASGAGTA